MDLYHADIRLPDGFVTPTARVRLIWTHRADRARFDDRFANVIPKFDNIPLSAFKVIEVGVEADRVVKIVVRGHWTTDLDLVFVLIPSTRTSWLVKTVWINRRNDVHKSLDRSKYVQ